MDNFPIFVAVLALFCGASDAQQPAEPPPPVCTATSVCESTEFIVHYIELGCTPSKTFLPMSCCPISYDCSKVINRPTNVCQFRGKNYTEGGKIGGSELGVRCLQQCTCKKAGTGVAWSCTQETCAPLAPSCVPVYASTSQCCPTCNVTTVAAATVAAATPAKVAGPTPKPPAKGPPAKSPPAKVPPPKGPPAKAPAKAPVKAPVKGAPAKTSKLVEVISKAAVVAAAPVKCTINNVNFREGENILTDNNMFCLCQRGFDGTQNGPWCTKISCGLELSYQDNIKKGCSPIYEQFKYCPVAWQCPAANDTIIRVDLTKTVDGQPLPKGTVLPAAAANKCTFGKNTMGWYDGLNLAPRGNVMTMCSCFTPPTLTCENMVAVNNGPPPQG